MKDIPIIILNKDRFEPLKQLISILNCKKYHNITIIDNKSTYPPLLDWYKNSNIDVFYNDIPETLFDNGTLYRLMHEIKHPKFVDLTQGYYVFTDSDVVPIDDIPDNFIEDMIYVLDKYKKHKIGLGLKIDDLPENQPSTKDVLQIETPYWNTKLEDPEFDLYASPVDTTFAVYSPGSTALWASDCFRMGGKYIAKHMPWYYDINNLPEDEYHYLKNLEHNKGPVYSYKNKTFI
jgi:hypothetical protein